MFEDEDMILPDDYQEDLPQSEEEVTDTQEPVEQVEDTKPTEPMEPVEETPELFKLKYNKEEMEIPIDEARALAQKGMNFEKAVERAKQEARDAYIAEQGYEWNGRPITNESEYKQALMEQELIQKYQDRDLPPEVIQELVESRRDREERQREKEQRADEERKNQEYLDFFDYYRQANGKDFNPSQDKIPAEVLQMAESMPLQFAYMMYESQNLRTQIQTLKQNQSNSQKAPVQSVTAHGGPQTESEDEFLAGFNSI